MEADIGFLEWPMARKETLGDVSLVREKEKSLHDWQQIESEVEMLVEYFSKGCALVCDPLAGSFATAIACRRNGRKFVGCDMESESVEIGQARLEVEMGGLHSSLRKPRDT